MGNWKNCWVINVKNPFDCWLIDEDNSEIVCSMDGSRETPRNSRESKNRTFL